MKQDGLQCALVRGGTSKGLFIKESELPAENSDETLLSVFGSPSKRQIDGLGGATPTTSKLVVVSQSERPDADIAYTFGQVSIEEATIDYDGNCGNMTSGVGAFAVDEGLVEIDDDEAVTVQLYNTNTDSLLDQTVPLIHGRAATTGDYKIHGVPGTGARVDTTFHDPGGAFTGGLFPFGEPSTDLAIDGETVPVSVVDVTTPVVFVHASTLDLTGTELPPTLNEDIAVMDRIKRIRAEACVRLGLVDDPTEADAVSPNYPKIAIVTPPASYPTSTGESVAADNVDIVARVTSMPVIHPVYAVTSASCTAAAVNLPGTIPYEVASENTASVTIGHPQGTMTVRASVGENDSTVDAVTVGRTQRRLMDGVTYY